jgi:general secretion pathway protein D
MLSFRRLLPALLLASALCGPAGAEEDKITLNFVNADIETVVKAVSQITGKNFLLDPRVKGTVNVVSGKPVPQSLAYQFLLSALRMQNFAAVESNGVVKIMPEADAKTHGGPMRKGAGGPGGDQVVTKVFTLRYESALQLLQVLRPLIAPNNPITANAGTNSLVISDYADNLVRLEKIIEALDTPNGEEPQVIPIRNASAIDLANSLNRLYGEGGGIGGAAAGDSSQRITILADSRSNSLLVRSSNPGKLAQVRTLINTLDQPGSVAGNIHVIYLKNAEAAKVAQTLRGIVSGETSTASTGVTPLSPNPVSQSATSGGGATPSMSSTMAAGSQSATSAGSQSSSVSSGGAMAGGGFIQADPTNNALIITAPDAVYNNLQRVIDMLDKRRAQVLVEALIAELSSDRASEFGIQWIAGGSAAGKNASVIGGTNFGSGGQNIFGVIQGIASAKTTGSLGLSPGLNLAIGSSKAGLGVLARALETDAKANILSTPSLMTLDNEEATIVVGSNVPFISGQYAQTGSTTTASPFQTYDRKDVGLTLKIKPQISEGGLVRLQIYQEVSSVQAGTLSNASGPVTDKRSIQTSVIVDDGGIIVIGGLIQDNFNSGDDKVPLLGDIPGVGRLFSYKTRQRTKTNLMIFLRPKIIREASDYQSLTADRYDYVIGEQRKEAATTGLMFKEAAPPLLPSRNWQPTPVQAQVPASAAPAGAATDKQ